MSVECTTHRIAEVSGKWSRCAGLTPPIFQSRFTQPHLVNRSIYNTKTLFVQAVFIVKQSKAHF